MNTIKPAPQWQVIAAFAAIYLIWGSTYTAILFGLKSLPPFLLSGMRFSTAGAILIFWCLAKGQRPVFKTTLQHAFAGVLMLFGGTGAVVWVEQHITSGMAAIIVASLPFWFVLLDYRQWAHNFSQKIILLGVAIGFAGIITLFGADSVHLSEKSLFAMFVLLLGCISWAIGSLYIKYLPAVHSTTLNAGIQMLAAGLFSILVGAMTGETTGFSASAVGMESWLGLTYLVSFGSLIGYVSYVWLLGQRPTVQVGTYAYVNPVVALFLGWLIAGEPFSTRQILALVVILFGVLLINLPKYRSVRLKIS
ncbi:MAG: EamA family transporter [Saprospiraceae bacterium]|nr:EamA family transporter [Saprospiraceae bacterium]